MRWHPWIPGKIHDGYRHRPKWGWRKRTLCWHWPQCRRSFHFWQHWIWSPSLCSDAGIHGCTQRDLLLRGTTTKLFRKYSCKWVVKGFSPESLEQQLLVLTMELVTTAQHYSCSCFKVQKCVLFVLRSKVWTDVNVLCWCSCWLSCFMFWVCFLLKKKCNNVISVTICASCPLTCKNKVKMKSIWFAFLIRLDFWFDIFLFNKR